MTGRPQALVLDDPPPMPESALLMATAQIMAEGGAKHSPVNCNTVSSKTDCAASKKQKAEQLANAELIFAIAQLGKLPKNCLQEVWKSVFLMKIFKDDPAKNCEPQNVP